MRVKKLVVLLILTIMFVSEFSFLAYTNLPVYASSNDSLTTAIQDAQFENEHYKYYYAQLSETAKSIYDAICEMNAKGQLKSGNAKYDLISNKKIDASLVEAYKKGDNSLIIAVENARDAFYLDYPEVFYVNMEKLSIRITSDNNGYHVWLGTGNNDSYYIHDIKDEADVNSKQNALDAAIDSIVSGAKAIDADSTAGENIIVKRIEYVHEQVLKSTTYKLDNVCKPENAGHIRTPYGALVAGESVCEGYSKAMKVALDKLEIPSILVRGVYTHAGSNVEAHMWNYVKIDNKWYAIDATFDDGEGDTIYTQYLLAGENLMSQGHQTDGIMSAPEFEFVYPKLENDSYGVKEVANENGLVVKYEKTDGGANFTSSTFHISYKGMGFAEAKKAGYHFIVKFYQGNKFNNDIQTQDWCYILDDTDYFYGMIKDSKTEFDLTLYSMAYVEFGVTNVEIGPYNDKQNYTDKERLHFLWYLSDNDHILAHSGLLECPDANYVKPPQITGASPYVDSKLKPGKTTHIKISYDEPLTLVDDKKEASIKISTNAWTNSAVDNSEVRNFKMSGKNVEFDFTPSTKWGDNSVFYYFNLDNVIGSQSQRTPVPAHYYVQESFGCTYSMKQSGVWRVYGRPTLIESSDLSNSNWTLSDGTSVSGSLTDRLTLVTTKTSSAEKETMEDLIESKTSNEVLTTETYNIQLTLCQKNVIKTGQKVTVYLGFPEGYGPENAGVTFKAYHFIYKYGEIVGVEEIPCVITPYGLLITCSSFSPFAVSAVKAEGDLKEAEKSVIVTTGENGKIENLENSIITLSENDTKTLQIKADNGYQIDTLTVLGKKITEAIGESNYNIEINYTDLAEGNNIINATFVADEIIEKEVANGEKAVVPTIESAEITDMSDEIVANVGEKAIIAPKIKASNGIDTYQWYKDNEIISGQTNSKLVIENVKPEDEGNYQLVITSTLDTLSSTTKSKACKLLTSDFELSIETDEDEINPNDTFNATVSIKNLRNVKSGIIALTGRLAFEDSKLEMVKIEGKNGWDLSAFNDDNFCFVADNGKVIDKACDIFTIQFKVKESITTNQEASISLEDASASGGTGVILAVSNAAKKVNIVIKEVPDSIESDKYDIDEENSVISKVLPKTTVAEFISKVDTKGKEMTFKDAQGKTLANTDIISTGTTIKVGKELELTICVTGDINCNGMLDIDDLSKAKLHIINEEVLTGIQAKAGDVDYNSGITINDVARMKLVIIDLLELE